MIKLNRCLNKKYYKNKIIFNNIKWIIKKYIVIYVIIKQN